MVMWSCTPRGVWRRVADVTVEPNLSDEVALSAATGSEVEERSCPHALELAQVVGEKDAFSEIGCIFKWEESSTCWFGCTCTAAVFEANPMPMSWC